MAISTIDAGQEPVSSSDEIDGSVGGDVYARGPEDSGPDDDNGQDEDGPVAGEDEQDEDDTGAH